MTRFPSPFGVRVLKLFVSYRAWQEWHVVSVPFRGSCSEMLLTSCVRVALESFRPLSGFVF